MGEYRPDHRVLHHRCHVAARGPTADLIKDGDGFCFCLRRLGWAWLGLAWIGLGWAIVAALVLVPLVPLLVRWWWWRW